MMNEEPTLFDIPAFTQTVTCDGCGKSLFQISEIFKEDILIECGGCGLKFTIYTVKADEAIKENLLQEQVRQDQRKLNALLAIRLHSFEAQIGGPGEGAVLFFETFIKSVLDATTESIDGDILEELRELFFRRIKDSGLDEGQELFVLDVEKAVTETLLSSGYERDESAEIEGC